MNDYYFSSPVWCTKNNNPSCPHSHMHTIDLHKNDKWPFIYWKSFV